MPESILQNAMIISLCKIQIHLIYDITLVKGVYNEKFSMLVNHSNLNESELRFTIYRKGWNYFIYFSCHSIPRFFKPETSGIIMISINQSICLRHLRHSWMHHSITHVWRHAQTKSTTQFLYIVNIEHIYLEIPNCEKGKKFKITFTQVKILWTYIFNRWITFYHTTNLIEITAFPLMVPFFNLIFFVFIKLCYCFHSFHL